MERQPLTAAATEARQRYAAERAATDPKRVAQAVRVVVAAAPALTDEQVDRLRALLPPVDAPVAE